jgi:V/A-type H+-transporting ATPase subunit C
VKQENDLILSVLRTIISDDLSSLRGKVPYFFDVHTDIDLKKLLKSETFDELLDAVEHTAYEKILSPFYVRNKEMIRYLDIEFALEKHYYDEAFKRVDKNYHGKLNTLLKDIYYTKIELQNITKIYRLKKFYQSDPLTIKQLLNIKHSRMSEQKLTELIEIKDPNKILKHLASSELQYFKNDKDYVYIEYFAGKIKYDLAKKYMYFTNEVPLFFTAFVTLTELQVDNITNIIEGIRYKVNESELKQMLIY